MGLQSGNAAGLQKAGDHGEVIQMMAVKLAKESRRAQLLQSAKTVFSQSGYHTASIADIIERAGVARGTFYCYFDSKRQIFDQILDDLLQDIDRQIALIEVSPFAPSPMVQLRANLERVLALMLEDRHLVQILLYQAAGLDRDGRQKLDGFYRSVLDRIEAALRMGIAMGLVRPGNVPITAAGILGAIQGIVAQTAARADDGHDLDLIVDEILEFGLHGVLKA